MSVFNPVPARSHTIKWNLVVREGELIQKPYIPECLSINFVVSRAPLAGMGPNSHYPLNIFIADFVIDYETFNSLTNTEFSDLLFEKAEEYKNRKNTKRKDLGKIISYFYKRA